MPRFILTFVIEIEVSWRNWVITKVNQKVKQGTFKFIKEKSFEVTVKKWKEIGERGN